jgi:TctA family transporter
MSALIVIWVLCGIAGAVVAEKRGRNAGGWAIVCILTGVLGLLVLVVMPRRPPLGADGRDAG